MSANKFEMIAGIHAVQSTLRHASESIITLYLRTGKLNFRLQKLKQQANKLNVKLEMVDDGQLAALSQSTHHQGIVAQCDLSLSKPGNESTLIDILDQLDEEAFLLVLDGITDPHNLGACLRTADAAGVDAVIIPKDKAVGLTSTVRKVASGAAETVPLIQVTNLARTLDMLKQRGIWLTGTSDAAGLTLHEHNLAGSIAIIMGAEGKGLRKLTMERCDFLVSIPMLGEVESLNISVATGVMLYETLRQRRAFITPSAN